jgi:hypothetical protein
VIGFARNTCPQLHEKFCKEIPCSCKVVPVLN